MKPASRALGLGAAAAALVVCACATGGGAAGGAASGPRSAPDDGDLVDVVPAGPETLIDLDVAQLRASPWSRSLVAGAVADGRAAKTAAQGFDDLDDLDRVVFAVSEGDAGPTTLMVARGRFDHDRIAGAHPSGASSSSWKASTWRGSQVWEQGASAVALLTARTYLAGTPAAVREAIDCAWGLTAGVRRGGRMATVEQALAGDGDRPRPALAAIVTITEAMRARIGGQVDLPNGLEQVGVRLDLGRALDLDVLGLLATERDAAAATHTVAATLRDLRSRKALAAFGLTSVFDSADVRAAGTRVRAHLRLPEAKRDLLAERIAFVLQAIVAAHAK